MWITMLVFPAIKSIEYTLKELKFKWVELNYEGRKQVSELEKKYKDLYHEMFWNFMNFDKGENNWTEEIIDDFLESKGYKWAIFRIDMDLNHILDAYYELNPTYDVFKLVYNDREENVLENHFLKEIKRNRYFVECEKKVVDDKCYIDAIKEDSKEEIEKKNRNNRIFIWRIFKLY